MNNSLISKISTMSFLFRNYSLVKVMYMYLLIGCYKTKFLLWNTNNTDRNSANKQNTHTHTHTHTQTHTHTNFQRKITLERVSQYENKWDSPIFFKTTPPILPTPLLLWKKCEPTPFFSRGRRGFPTSRLTHPYTYIFVPPVFTAPTFITWNN